MALSSRVDRRTAWKAAPFNSPRSGDVVILDVWAAWRECCEKDLPVLDGVASRLKQSGVEGVVVSIDFDTGTSRPICRRTGLEHVAAPRSRGRVAARRPEVVDAVLAPARAGGTRCIQAPRSNAAVGGAFVRTSFALPCHSTTTSPMSHVASTSRSLRRRNATKASQLTHGDALLLLRQIISKRLRRVREITRWERSIVGR